MCLRSSFFTTLLLASWTLSVITADFSNYNPYQYDWTAPLFTPNGRLLQTEYAQAAADRSTPVIAARVNADLAVLACCRRSSNFQQARLILLPNLSSSSNGGDADTIVVALAGVLADSLSLLQAWQNQLVQDYRSYAGAKQPTARTMASVLASQCQHHAFGGGIRPIGSTVWVTGTQNWFENSHNNALLIYQTDPSGAVRDVGLHCHNHDHQSDNVVVVLGGGTSGSLVQRRLQREWVPSSAEDSNTSNIDIQRRIGQLLRIIMDEHQRSNVDKGSSREDDDHSKVALEVVLLSQTRGAIKLTTDQVQNLLCVGPAKI